MMSLKRIAFLLATPTRHWINRCRAHIHQEGATKLVPPRYATGSEQVQELGTRLLFPKTCSTLDDEKLQKNNDPENATYIVSIGGNQSKAKMTRRLYKLLTTSAAVWRRRI